MQSANLYWQFEPDEPALQIPVQSVEELDKRLDAIAHTVRPERPVVVSVERAIGDWLEIGIGNPVWINGEDEEVAVDLPYPVTVLNYIGADGDPPYLLSSGKEGLSCNPVYFYGGYFSEFPASAVIASSKAREALRRFISSPGLPQNIDWVPA